MLAGEIEKLKIGEAAVAADRSDYGLGPAASKVYRAERGISIGGYGELVYQHIQEVGDEEHTLLRGKAEEEEEDEDQPGDHVDVRRAVFYFGYKWSDRILFNSEIEYEHAGGEVSVEFAYLDFLWRPEANLRAGLVLLPVGFVNELHEPTVLLGADRPIVEQRILPTTWREAGFGLFGQAGPFTYRTYIVNGLDASGFTDDGLRGGRQGGTSPRPRTSPGSAGSTTRACRACSSAAPPTPASRARIWRPRPAGISASRRGSSRGTWSGGGAASNSAPWAPRGA